MHLNDCSIKGREEYNLPSSLLKKNTLFIIEHSFLETSSCFSAETSMRLTGLSLESLSAAKTSIVGSCRGYDARHFLMPTDWTVVSCDFCVNLLFYFDSACLL